VLYCEEGREGGVERGVVLLDLFSSFFPQPFVVDILFFFTFFLSPPPSFNLLASLSLASFGLNFPGVLGCKWELAVDSRKSERGETEGRKEARPESIGESMDWTGTEYWIGIWTTEMAMMECVFRVALGESLASRLFFFLFLFIFVYFLLSLSLSLSHFVKSVSL